MKYIKKGLQVIGAMTVLLAIVITGLVVSGVVNEKSIAETVVNVIGEDKIEEIALNIVMNNKFYEVDDIEEVVEQEAPSEKVEVEVQKEEAPTVKVEEPKKEVAKKEAEKVKESKPKTNPSILDNKVVNNILSASGVKKDELDKEVFDSVVEEVVKEGVDSCSKLPELLEANGIDSSIITDMNLNTELLCSAYINNLN